MGIDKRLLQYFEAVGQVLRGDASKAAIFANPADVGGTREEIFCEFLRSHLPAWCSIERGGFLFNWERAESGQLDIVISSGYSPKFVPFPENGKVVREIEGVIGVTSIKSTLTPTSMRDALKEFARIPQMRTNDTHVNPAIKNAKMEHFIFLHLYASACENLDPILKAINAFYEDSPEVPINRRPDLIHVNSEGVIFKGKSGTLYGDMPLEAGKYYGIKFKSNFFGLSFAIDEIRRRVALLPHVNFQFSDLPTLLFEAHGPDDRHWQLL